MAGAELERSRQAYYAAAVEVRSSARAARNHLMAARARMNYYREVILPLRRQITEQTQLQYNGMFVGAFQLLQAKQAEVEAGIAYINALHDYWNAKATLDQIESGGTVAMDMSPAPMMSLGPSSNGIVLEQGKH
jgi:outer membrane protein TolC